MSHLPDYPQQLRYLHTVIKIQYTYLSCLYSFTLLLLMSRWHFENIVVKGQNADHHHHTFLKTEVAF